MTHNDCRVFRIGGVPQQALKRAQLNLNRGPVDVALRIRLIVARGSIHTVLLVKRRRCGKFRAGWTSICRPRIVEACYPSTCRMHSRRCRSDAAFGAFDETIARPLLYAQRDSSLDPRDLNYARFKES